MERYCGFATRFSQRTRVLGSWVKVVLASSSLTVRFGRVPSPGPVQVKQSLSSTRSTSVLTTRLLHDWPRNGSGFVSRYPTDASQSRTPGCSKYGQKRRREKPTLTA